MNASEPNDGFSSLSLQSVEGVDIGFKVLETVLLGYLTSRRNRKGARRKMLDSAAEIEPEEIRQIVLSEVSRFSHPQVEYSLRTKQPTRWLPFVNCVAVFYVILLPPPRNNRDRTIRGQDEN